MTVVCTKVLAQTWCRERALAMFFDLSQLALGELQFGTHPQAQSEEFSPVLPHIHLAVLHANVWLEGKAELHVVLSTVSLRCLAPKG